MSEIQPPEPIGSESADTSATGKQGWWSFKKASPKSIHPTVRTDRTLLMYEIIKKMGGYGQLATEDAFKALLSRWSYIIFRVLYLVALTIALLEITKETETVWELLAAFGVKPWEAWTGPLDVRWTSVLTFVLFGIQSHFEKRQGEFGEWHKPARNAFNALGRLLLKLIFNTIQPESGRIEFDRLEREYGIGGPLKDADVPIWNSDEMPPEITFIDYDDVYTPGTPELLADYIESYIFSMNRYVKKSFFVDGLLGGILLFIGLPSMIITFYNISVLMPIVFRLDKIIKEFLEALDNSKLREGFRDAQLKSEALLRKIRTRMDKLQDPKILAQYANAFGKIKAEEHGSWFDHEVDVFQDLEVSAEEREEDLAAQTALEPVPTS